MRNALLLTEASVYTQRGKLIARGGGEVYFHEVAKSLISIGISPTILALKEFHGQKNEEVIEGVTYRRVNITSKASIKVVGYLMRAMRESKNYDIIFFNQFTPHLILPWVRGKKIAVIHDVYQNFGSSFWTKQYGFFKGSIGKVIEKLQLSLDARYADTIITVSYASRQKIIDILGQRIKRKIVMNPSQVDPQDYVHNTSKEDFLLFIGRFVPYKNPEHALYTLKRIQTLFSDFKAVFVVPRAEENVLANFKKQIRVLGIKEGDVSIIFNCDSDQLKHLLAKAKLLLQPSYVEGQGIVILEALASRTPVVAYRLKAYEGTLISGQNSILVNIGDQEALAKASIRILQNYAFYRNNCRIYFKKNENNFTSTLQQIVL